MNAPKTPTDFPSALSRSVLGVLAFVVAFLLCAPLSSQAHLGDPGKRLALLDISAASELLSPRGLLMVVPAEDNAALDAPSELIEDSDWTRLDAALARIGADRPSGIYESLHNGNSQFSARTTKQSPEVQPDSADIAFTVSATVLPRLADDPVVLPIGTPFCFLPTERGLVSYPTPPPHI